MKIFLLASYDRSLVNFRGPLIRDMVSRGHEVIAAAPLQDKTVPNELSELGARFVDVPFSRAGTNPTADLALTVRLRATLKQIQPDVFLAYTVKPVVYGSLAARSAGVPRITSMITGAGYAFAASGIRIRLLSGIVRRLYKEAMKCNDLVFFQNPDDLREFVRRGYLTERRAVRTNGSGIDLERFPRFPLPQHRKSFLLVARLLRDKGVCEFAQAAESTRRNNPDAEFHLVGPYDPNPKGLTAETIQSWERKGLIKYHGYQSDVRPFLRDCGVFVLPSYYPEGLPRTLLEAMAVGRPIITTDSIGCREAIELSSRGRVQRSRGDAVVEGTNGFMVRPRDSVAIADAVERLISDPERLDMMARRSAEIACESFDVRAVNKLMLDRLGL